MREETAGWRTVKTLTVLFSDMVDSTSTRARLGEDLAEELRERHDQVVRTVVVGNRGAVAKHTGDGVMATFEGAVDAVAAAVAIQQDIDWESRQGHLPEPVQVRIGISAGDVTMEGTDCFGMPVVEAQRLEGAASPGQILVSSLVPLLGKGRSGQVFTPIGALELKGLDAPVHAEEVRWEPRGPELIPIVVVEDHPLYRQGLTQTASELDELNLIAATPCIEDLDPSELAKAKVAILDLHLPGMEGPEAVAFVRAAGLQVLVLSASDEPSEVIEAIGAGAAGYLTKSADTDEIVQAIHIVSTGGTYVSPILAGHLLNVSQKKEPASHLELTPREREILELVAEGETDADIAGTLYISVHTVHSHLDRIREKTGRRRRPELTRFAIEHDIRRQQH